METDNLVKLQLALSTSHLLSVACLLAAFRRSDLHRALNTPPNMVTHVA